MKLNVYDILYPATDVMSETIGIDANECLIVKEHPASRMFSIKGKTASAIWSRINGKRNSTAICRDMVDHTGISPNSAEQIVLPFLQLLLDAGIISSEPDDNKHRFKDQQLPEINWPAEPAEALLLPFNLQPFISTRMTALGSYVGGTSNVSSITPCTGGDGGIGNAGGAGVCRPGDGYGFFNGGWFGRPCKN